MNEPFGRCEKSSQGSQGGNPRNPRVSRVEDPARAGEIARFWAKVDKGTDPDGCWEWTGARSKKNYGRIRVFRDGRWTHMQAHRWAYEDAYGPIPDGLYPDHTCHTEALRRGECDGGSTCPHRACPRPDHLELVTDEENRRRARRTA
jgi:hypothetical protein